MQSDYSITCTQTDLCKYRYTEYDKIATQIIVNGNNLYCLSASNSLQSPNVWSLLHYHMIIGRDVHTVFVSGKMINNRTDKTTLTNECLYNVGTVALLL